MSQGEKKARLQKEIRKELGRRGYFVGQYWDRIWSAKMEPLQINMNFTFDRDDMVVTWTCRLQRHKYTNPSVKGIVDFLIKNLKTDKEEVQPPPAIRFNKDDAEKAATPKGARVANSITITAAEFQEYQLLKEKDSKGVWLSSQMFQEVKKHFIPPKLQTEVLRRMDNLIRRMSI